MNISAIIPNYNGEQLLKKNLPQVIEAMNYYGEKTNTRAEIIVADDASTDKSIEEIKNQKSRIKNDYLELKFIENEKNLGFASTANHGVKRAKGEVIILLNTDVSPEKDFLIPLIIHFKDEKVFAVGCMDKSMESDRMVLRGRGLGKWERGFLVHCRGEVDKTDTLWVNGGSGAFRKSIWDRLGGFNEIYKPFYWEDIDLSYRALKSGFKIKFEPKSVVKHEHDKGIIKQKYSSEIKLIAYRNQILFVWLNITDLTLMLLHIFWLPYHIWRGIKNDRIFIKGLFLAFIKIPEVFLYRLKLLKLFTKTDKEIMQRYV